MGTSMSTFQREQAKQSRQSQKKLAEEWCHILVASGQISNYDFQSFSEHLARQPLRKDRFGSSAFDRRLAQLRALPKGKVTRFSESFQRYADDTSSVMPQETGIQDLSTMLEQMDPDSLKALVNELYTRLQQYEPELTPDQLMLSSGATV